LAVYTAAVAAPVGQRQPLLSRLAASGSIDDKTNIACFAVFARRKLLALGPTVDFSERA